MASGDTKIIDFEYMKFESLPILPIIIGSIEVCFVAILETLISARIADNIMGGERFNQ